VKADGWEAIARGLSFSPSRLSRISKKLNAEKKTDQAFQEERSNLYSRYRNYWNEAPEDRNTNDLYDIFGDIYDYNDIAGESGRPLVTPQTLKGAVAKRGDKKKPGAVPITRTGHRGIAMTPEAVNSQISRGIPAPSR
jgi:hypothetical protein